MYRIDCECGDYYIGETSRPLTTRVKEHKADCKHARFERSAIAEHAWQDGHSIDWENVQVVDVAEDTQMRLVKEAVHIRMGAPQRLTNRDEGKEISSVWLQVVRSNKPHPLHRSRQPCPPRE